MNILDNWQTEYGANQSKVDDSVREKEEPDKEPVLQRLEKVWNQSVRAVRQQGQVAVNATKKGLAWAEKRLEALKPPTHYKLGFVFGLGLKVIKSKAATVSLGGGLGMTHTAKRSNIWDRENKTGIDVHGKLEFGRFKWGGSYEAHMVERGVTPILPYPEFEHKGSVNLLPTFDSNGASAGEDGIEITFIIIRFGVSWRD